MFKKIVAAWPISRTEVLAWFGEGEIRRLDVTTLENSVPVSTSELPPVAIRAEGFAVAWAGVFEMGSEEFFERSVPIDVVGPECRRIVGEVVSARRGQGFSQQKIARATGMKQPVVARLETSTSSPRIDTLLRLLAPLGKTLEITNLSSTDIEGFELLEQ